MKPARVYNVYKNTAYTAKGGDPDIGYVQTANNDLSVCKRACDNTPNCFGFATDNKNNCWLKNDKLGNAFQSHVDHYYTGMTLQPYVPPQPQPPTPQLQQLLNKQLLNK